MSLTDRDWTAFSIEAEIESFGESRIIDTHNDLRAEVKRLTAINDSKGEGGKMSETINAALGLPPRLDHLFRVLIDGTEAVDPQWDRLVAASDVDLARKELERLGPINAELLAACQAALTVEFRCGFNRINHNEVRAKIEAAIAKARPG